MAVEGRRGFVEAIDYLDHPIIAYLRIIPGTDWYMVAKTDKAEIFEPIQREAIVITVIVILFLLFIGIIFYLIFKNAATSYFIKQAGDELGLRSSKDISQRKHFEYQIQKRSLFLDKNRHLF